MKKENILRLLIIDDSSNDAEAVTGMLRRAGLGVRASRVTNQDGLRAALDEQAPDIILCAAKLAEFTAMKALALTKSSGKDIVFILLSNTLEEPIALDLLHAGARDVVSKDQPERLQLVLTREFGDLEERRAHRRCASALREAEKRARSLMESSRDAIAYVHDGMHIYANGAYLNLFGYHSRDEIEGTPILDMVAQDSLAQFKDFLRKYGKDEVQAAALEVRWRRVDGAEFTASMEFSPASIDGEACTQIIIQDLSQHQEFENKLKSLSKQDLLTGLYNRQHFLEELEAAITRATGGGGNSALLYIELDHFQNIKEQAGIAAGDLVLSDIAALLRKHVDDSMLLARFGDDIFTLLIHNKDADHAHQTAERLRKAVEEGVYDAAGLSATTTCCIAIGLITEYVLSSKELLSHISKACAAAKSAGGNRVHLHSPDAEAGAAKDTLQQWARRIQTAVDNKRLRLTYQPIVSLRGAAGEHYQVLLRMLDEQGKEIDTVQFAAATEQTGAGPAIDRWVITQAIEVLAAKRRAGGKQVFFIKLFAETLKDDKLLPWLSERLKAARLQGDSLIFEAGETAAMRYLKDTQALIKGLKELRCQFSLDHFGCDPNSLGNLKRFSMGVSYVKIDGSFMANLTGNAQNQAAVKAINDAAHAARMITIAECVQDAGSLALLWQYGVDYVQGYYLQKPSEMLNYDFSV